MCVPYKDGTWSQRAEGLGDQAEAVFEGVCADVLNLNFVRAGLNRPPLQVHRLPKIERYRPDYLLSSKYVEVQGFGRDGIVKLKFDKWYALGFWNFVFPVDVFLFDSHKKRWCFLRLEQLTQLAKASGKFNSFNEGNMYVEIVGDECFEASELVGEAA